MIRETLLNRFNTSTMYAALILVSATLALSACSGGGGGSGGSKTDLDDDNCAACPDWFGRDNDENPDQIFPGPGDPEIKVIRTGEGVVNGHINVPGDWDYFQLQLVEDARYGLQTYHFPTDFGNQPVNSEHEFNLFNSTGVDGTLPEVLWTGDSAWPPSVTIENFSLVGPTTGGATGMTGGNLAFSWVAPYTGIYYLRVNNHFDAGIGEYSFRLMSSQLGVATTRETGTSNIRSYEQLFDPDEGFLRYEIPQGQPLSASLSTVEFYIGPSSVGTTGRLSFPLPISITQPIFFFDEEGTLEDTPQTPVFHLHWGIPSRHLADGVDDIIYNPGPTNNYLSNLNLDGPPGYVIEIVFDPEGDFNIDEFLAPDVVHLMLGQNWYMDVHYHAEFGLLPTATASTPLVVSRPQGGLSMYDSRFVLDGFTFPDDTETGASEELEVFYSDEHQAFYLQYGYNSSLAGQDIHVHAGGTQNTGPIIADLGTVPFPTARPTYEPEGDIGPLGPGNTFRFIPNLENIIKKITNEEAQAMRDALFNDGGWYIDVHTAPFFSDPDHPLIRADAILFDTLETAGFYAPDILVRSDEEYDGQLARLSVTDVGKTGDLNFVSDDLAYGPIVVYLDNLTMGQLDMAVGEKAIACGQDVPGQSIGVAGKSGTYNYHGSAADGVYWEGTVTIEAGSCTTLVLASEDAITEE